MTSSRKPLRLRMKDDSQERPPESPSGPPPDKPVAPAPEEKAFDPLQGLSLSPRHLMIAGIGAGIILLFGIFISLVTVIVSLAVALVVASVLGLTAQGLGKKNIPYLHAVIAQYAATLLVLALFFLVCLPKWQRHSERFGFHLIQLSAKLVDLTAKPAPTVKPSADTIDSKAGSSTVETAKDGPVTQSEKTEGHLQKGSMWLYGKTQAVVVYINNRTRAAISQKVRVFFQLSSLIGVFLSIPFFIPRRDQGAEAAPSKGPAALLSYLSSRFVQFTAKIGRLCFYRLLKAMLLGIATVIGLKISSLNTSLFIAGCVFVVSFFSRYGPGTAIFLALFMLPLAPNKMWMGIGILATGVCLFFLEKKLHWYLILFPALKSGMVPEELATGSQASEERGSGVSMLWKMVRLAVSAAIIGTLVYLLHDFFTLYSSDQAHKDALNESEDKLKKVYALSKGEEFKPDSDTVKTTIEAYKKLREKYPNDREVLLGLVKSHSKGLKWEEARSYADMIANWKKEEKKDISWRESLYEKFFSSSNGPGNPAEGYEAIIESLGIGGDPNFHQDLANRILAFNKESPHACFSLAVARFAENKPDEVIEHAKRGAGLNSKYPYMHFCLARAYYAKGDLKSALAECDAELAIDPNNDETLTLKTTVAKAGTTTGQSPPTPVGKP